RIGEELVGDALRLLLVQFALHEIAVGRHHEVFRRIRMAGLECPAAQPQVYGFRHDAPGLWIRLVVREQDVNFPQHRVSVSLPRGVEPIGPDRLAAARSAGYRATARIAPALPARA